MLDSLHVLCYTLLLTPTIWPPVPYCWEFRKNLRCLFCSHGGPISVSWVLFRLLISIIFFLSSVFFLSPFVSRSSLSLMKKARCMWWLRGWSRTSPPLFSCFLRRFFSSMVLAIRVIYPSLFGIIFGFPVLLYRHCHLWFWDLLRADV